MAPYSVQRSLVLFAVGILVSGPGIRGRQLQVEHDSDCGAPTKGLVELRECGSYPSFLVIAHSTCNYFSPWLAQGQRLTDKLRLSLYEGVCAQPPPNSGDYPTH